MSLSLLTLELRLEHDIVHARQRARKLASLLGFEAQDQSRIATAVSEMARNAFSYAGGGKVEFSIGAEDSEFVVRVSDHGPGIANLKAIFDGEYRSNTGMGLGLIGTKRLMDSFDIQTNEQGTQVTFAKQLPRRASPPTQEGISHIVAELARELPASPLEEVQQQNQELLRALEEVRQQQNLLAQVNRELEETNRGVVALYAEIEERADYLQRANEIKTKFLSNMTHEFRTPLNSIINLTRILLDRLDGELSSEQDRQVRYIAKSATDLSDLVNDLLDLAKVEAGKILIRPTEFYVSDLFGALRGMLRPLLTQNTSVNLIVEEPVLPPMRTDESKVSQILRNFISNAIKYTDSGEVRVSARLGADDTMIFSVSDTGIGIALEDQDRIFEEYTQIESPAQRRTKGTGLGLPLSRRLAGLLGGSVRVSSTLGTGSTFSAIIPMHFKGASELVLVPEVSREIDPLRAPVLVVEDNREALFAYEKFLKGSGFQVLPGRTLKEAREWLRSVKPVAIVLDLLLETESTWGLLSELRQSEATHDIPIMVVTMVDNERRAKALGADIFHLKPIDREWLLATLTALTRSRAQELLLIVDDDEVSRYVLSNSLTESRFRLVEASDGRQGLEYAEQLKPSAIFLDIGMEGMDGFNVLEELKTNATVSDIPVIIYTAKLLTAEDRRRLSHAVAVVPKESASREAARESVRAALQAAGLGAQ